MGSQMFMSSKQTATAAIPITNRPPKKHHQLRRFAAASLHFACTPQGRRRAKNACLAAEMEPSVKQTPLIQSPSISATDKGIASWDKHCLALISATPKDLAQMLLLNSSGIYA
jgi:hypothetical protein